MRCLISKIPYYLVISLKVRKQDRLERFIEDSELQGLKKGSHLNTERIEQLEKSFDNLMTVHFRIEQKEEKLEELIAELQEDVCRLKAEVKAIPPQQTEKYRP